MVTNMEEHNVKACDVTLVGEVVEDTEIVLLGRGLAVLGADLLVGGEDALLELLEFGSALGGDVCHRHWVLNWFLESG